MSVSRARILAAASGKGGSGKTVSAIGLCWMIARLLSLRVALLDLDVQGSLAGYLGLGRASAPLTDPPRNMHGIDVYSGGAALASATLEDIQDHIARAAAASDVVVIDCPPDLTSIPHSAIFEYPVDLVLGIVRLEPGSIAPIQSLTAVCQRSGTPLLVLPNVETSKANAAGSLIALRAIYSETETVLPAGPCPTLLPYQVPSSEYAPTSITKRVPLTALRSSSGPSRVFTQLVSDLHSWGAI